MKRILGTMGLFRRRNKTSVVELKRLIRVSFLNIYFKLVNFEYINLYSYNYTYVCSGVVIYWSNVWLVFVFSKLFLRKHYIYRFSLSFCFSVSFSFFFFLFSSVESTLILTIYIKYVDVVIIILNLISLKEEVSAAGSNLGYKSMHHKLEVIHGITASRYVTLIS